MKLEKQKAFVIHVIFFAFIILLAYIGLKYVLPILTPFVIGFIVAFLLRPVIDWITSKVPVKRSFVAVTVLIITYAILVLMIILFGSKLFSFLEEVFAKIPSIYSDTVQPAIMNVLSNTLSDVGKRFPDINLDWDKVLNSINESLSTTITSISTTVLSTFTGFAGQVPSFLIKFLFTIVSSFFFTVDYYKIVSFIMKQLPEDRKEAIMKVKRDGVGTVGKFLRAYLTLIIITFIELAIGFSILGVPNALVVAAVVAFIDILPILGTGAVLLPWVILSFIFGKTTFAIGMLILYVIITVVRQTLEPRVVGSQIGLHPVVTLICMFVGTSLFGILGLFLFPITATIIKQMNDEGAIHLFK